MLCNWKTLGVLALLAIPLAAAPSRAQEVDIKETLKKVDAQLQAIIFDLGKLNLRIDKLESDVRKVSVSLYPPTDTTVEGRLKQLEEAIKGLPKGRVSLYPASMARVRLVNQYSRDVWFVVNQQRLVLKPGETQDVDVAPGPVAWEVISPTHGPNPIAADTKTMRAGELLTLPARP